mmetsp:Transcript_42922/g.97005  ORF Transcript_42922/g.97005 Transcript_42922/m.97005 type:complete len:353 (+) Transcript_42922:1386-2444(+)
MSCSAATRLLGGAGRRLAVGRSKLTPVALVALPRREPGGECFRNCLRTLAQRAFARCRSSASATRARNASSCAAAACSSADAPSSSFSTPPSTEPTRFFIFRPTHPALMPPPPPPAMEASSLASSSRFPMSMLCSSRMSTSSRMTSRDEDHAAALAFLTSRARCTSSSICCRFFAQPSASCFTRADDGRPTDWSCNASRFSHLAFSSSNCATTWSRSSRMSAVNSSAISSSSRHISSASSRRICFAFIKPLVRSTFSDQRIISSEGPINSLASVLVRGFHRPGATTSLFSSSNRSCSMSSCSSLSASASRSTSAALSASTRESSSFAFRISASASASSSANSSCTSATRFAR